MPSWKSSRFRSVVVLPQRSSLRRLRLRQRQDWPSRPITMVMPFAAGGPMDTLARILQTTP